MLHTMQDAATSPSNIDLASLASQAAIALDNIILGRGNDVTPVRDLMQILTGNLKSSALDLTTAVALQHALEMPGGTGSRTVPELLSNASDFLKRLSNVVDNAPSDMEETKRLRALCVALSQHATAIAGPLYNRAKRPSRY